MRRIATLLTFAALFAAAMVAQSEKARIVGTVADSSGAVVPNAKVSITHIATKNRVEVTTNPSGAFVATALQPGELRELALGLLEPAHHRVPMGHQRLARGGQLGSVTGALEQWDADLALQHCDLLADRGLREMQ